MLSVLPQRQVLWRHMAWTRDNELRAFPEICYDYGKRNQIYGFILVNTDWDKDLVQSRRTSIIHSRHQTSHFILLTTYLSSKDMYKWSRYIQTASINYTDSIYHIKYHILEASFGNGKREWLVVKMWPFTIRFVLQKAYITSFSIEVKHGI